MTERTAAPRRRVSLQQARAAELVGRTVDRVQPQYVGRGRPGEPHPTAESRAVLARLRRGVGKRLGDLPDLVEFVVDTQDVPGAEVDDGPSQAEVAAYTALTLYAVHQQSRTDAGMHVSGRPLGRALGRLQTGNKEKDSAVIRRFQAFATAADLRELSTHLRGLVTQLRAKEIGFDYQQLAEDLVGYQEGPESVARVRLRWGRDFFRVPGSSDPTATDGATDQNQNEEQS